MNASYRRGDSLASEWAPVRRVSLSDEIADRLISSILAGRFKFGERLPPERDLAKYLDVGRPAVREALRTLSVIGLVEVRPGEGAFVVNRHSDFVAKAFSWTILLDARTVEEIVEVRTAIESELARLAADRASTDDLDMLRQLVETMERSKGRSEEFSAADVGFHLGLARVAGNVALERLLWAIQSLLKEWIQAALARPHTFETAQLQHRDVMAAIEKGDGNAAGEAMRAHIEAMGQLIGNSVRENARAREHASVAPLEIDRSG